MRIFAQTDNGRRITLLDTLPQRIQRRPDGPAVAHFPGGETASLACLGCLDPPCMQFSPEEIQCSQTPAFPHDASRQVCAAEALHWDWEQGTPAVDGERCIRCGVCVGRCPAGALYFQKGEVRVRHTPASRQQPATVEPHTAALQKDQLQALEGVEKRGPLLAESDALMTDLYQKLVRLNHRSHNLLVRNLLIALGCHSATPRIGDVYTRMDALYGAADGSFGAVEVEFGKETLDASRAILDDIAVLFTRYGIPKAADRPLVVCLRLPNARQGYWQVVQDVKTVEQIAIGTLSVGALLLLHWNGCSLLPAEQRYYLDSDDRNLRPRIEAQLGRPVQLSPGLEGILEPVK